MAGRNVLEVVPEDGFQSDLRRSVAERGGGVPHVCVVAPARVSPLEWFATDEDAARAEAEVRALESEWSLRDEAEVEGGAGEADAVVAVEDALRGFSADEILLVGGAAENGGLEMSLRRFGLPVTRVPESVPVRERSELREVVRGLTSGRSRATPFVMFVGVNLFLFTLAVLIAMLVLLVLWSG